MASLSDMRMPTSTVYYRGDLCRWPRGARNYWPILPSEIIMSVFEELTTVEDLWCMACSSRRLWHLFHLHGPQILEMVLLDDTHPWVCNVIHATFNLQALDSCEWTYTELRHLDSYGPREPLSPTAHPHMIRRFVTKARKIHALAHIILGNCMHHLWTLEDKLRPYDADEECPEIYWYLDREANPGEETRAVMALWMFELHFTLILACRNPHLAWVRTMFQTMPPASTDLFHFFRKTWFGPLLTMWHGLLQLKYPADFLDKQLVTDASLPRAVPLPRLPRGGLVAAHRCATELPNYSPHNRHSMFERMQMGRVMRQQPLVSRFFGSLRAVSPEQEDDDGGLFQLPYRPFVKYGFFHWDHEKMQSISLLPCGELDRAALFRYWRGLLPDHIVAAYAKQQEGAKARHWEHMARLVAAGQPIPEPQDAALFQNILAEDPETEEEDEEMGGEEEETEGEDEETEAGDEATEADDPHTEPENSQTEAEAEA
ncbi:F-box Skp2 [Cordyceps militaris]|uniref:F-box Skp2 n=1 Tax=Cordyceps militaris TaxID=73501 RepID=A0A2H4SJ14_CORMI|nr:F-box Skp2 [Cordyceps militaris]